MSKKVNILFCIFLLTSFKCLAQGTVTNIDTIVVQPKWQTNYLNSIKFQNGDDIPICDDLNSWKFHNHRNKPAVYVTQNNVHLYNYYALSDSRNLCPRYYRPPTFHDVSQSSVEIKNPSTLKNISGILFIEPLNWIDISSGIPDLRSATFPASFGSSSEWIRKDKEYSSDYYFATFSINKNGIVTEFPEPKNGTGVPIKCITDLGAIIQDSVFEYKQLVWGQYTAALNDMLHASVDYFEIGKPFKIQLAGTIEAKRNTAQNFRIKSSDFTISGKTKNLTHLLIEERLLEALRVKIPLPMYKGTSLLAQSNFNLTLKREIFKTPEQRFYTNQVMRSSVALSDVHINYANDHGFRVKTYKEVISMAEGAQTLYSKADLKVSSFHSRGSIYSLAAVLPGLGLKTVNRIQYKESGTKPQEKLSKTFLISSISLGTIGVAAKIYSEIQYKKYRDNPFGISEQRNYEMANLSNQIFISSLLGYGVLSILDFSISFGIGVKNKTTQAQLNRQLKKEGHLSLKSDFSKELIAPPRLSSSTTHSSDQLPIRGTFMDSRDGKNYKTVVIGTQTWMAENLAYKPKKGNYWAYDNNMVNVKQYGYLYDWKTACEVCPEGWRLPTEEDWTVLIKSFKISKIINDLTAVPGGYYNSSGKYFSMGYSGTWWSLSQTENFKSKADFYQLNTNELKLGSFSIQNGFSVRCIKN
jgi:uncharacterized protein (TIGR02145 family)